MLVGFMIMSPKLDGGGDKGMSGVRKADYEKRNESEKVRKTNGCERRITKNEMRAKKCEKRMGAKGGLRKTK
jgi:hypothetical protein